MLEEDLISDRKPSGVPDESRVSHAVVVGVVAPHNGNILSMERMYFSTDSFLIGFPCTYRSQAQMKLTKIWRKGIGSLMPSRSGVMCIQLQKRRHWHQEVASFLNYVYKNPLEIAGFAAL